MLAFTESAVLRKIQSKIQPNAYIWHGTNLNLIFKPCPLVVHLLKAQLHRLGLLALWMMIKYIYLYLCFVFDECPRYPTSIASTNSNNMYVTNCLGLISSLISSYLPLLFGSGYQCSRHPEAQSIFQYSLSSVTICKCRPL
jgi:hypothetical protein